jgi:hypothetical protein
MSGPTVLGRPLPGRGDAAVCFLSGWKPLFSYSTAQRVLPFRGDKTRLRFEEIREVLIPVAALRACRAHPEWQLDFAR